MLNKIKSMLGMQTEEESLIDTAYSFFNEVHQGVKRISSHRAATDPRVMEILESLLKIKKEGFNIIDTYKSTQDAEHLLRLRKFMDKSLQDVKDMRNNFGKIVIEEIQKELAKEDHDIQ